MSLINAITDKYGVKRGLSVSGGKIKSWPYEVPQPTKTKLKTLVDNYNSSRPAKEAKEKAFLVHREIVNDMTVEANGKKYCFDHFSMFFFLAEFIGTNGSGFEWKAKGEAKRHHTRKEVEAIYTAARDVIRASFSAYDTDRTSIIDNGDLSLSNVKAEKKKQDDLK